MRVRNTGNDILNIATYIIYMIIHFFIYKSKPYKNKEAEISKKITLKT